MATMELPELELVPMPLYAEDRMAKRPDPAGRAVPDVVALGVPQAIRLRPDDLPDDPDLARFLRARADRAFAMVTLGVTFRPGDDDLTQASVDVVLRADPGDELAAVAWSLAPLRVAEPVAATRRISISADAKILNLGVESTRERTTRDVFCEAFNELRPDPYWEFTPTPAGPLRGSHRLTMVTSAPAESRVTGTVSVSATIRHRRFGLFSARSEDSDDTAFTVA